MDKRLKKNTENCKVKSLKSALSPPPFMLGMLFILANGGKINSLEVTNTHCYLNASDISMQRGKSSKLQILNQSSGLAEIRAGLHPGLGLVCPTEQQLFAKFWSGSGCGLKTPQLLRAVWPFERFEAGQNCERAEHCLGCNSE